MTPEIKQVQEAADAFKDDKINQVEANKIAEAIDPAKIKSTDIQEFLKDSKSYPSFLDGIINNIENYTNGSKVQIGPTLPGTLQIEENKIPLKQLSKEEKDKIMNDAKNFLLRVKDEKRKLSNTNTKPSATPEQKEDKTKVENNTDKKDIPYDTDKPLNSMLLAINDNLPEDKQIKQSPESMRDNLKSGILIQIEKELRRTLRINEKELKDGVDENNELLYKKLLEGFREQLTDKRLNNLILGGIYVTINGIKQKMDKPDNKDLQNYHDFNIVGINIMSNIKDINSLLSANGNIMENLFKNSQENIVNKIKEKFSKKMIRSMNNNEFKNYLNDTNTNGFLVKQGKETNPVKDIFKDIIKIDSEIDAVNFIENNNGLPKSTAAEVGVDGADMQKKLADKIKTIIGEVPTTLYEKEAFKTELIQNKFSGWSKSVLEAVYNFAQKLGLGDLLGMFNKDGLFDKVLLSKSRNDALIAKDLYNKDKDSKTATEVKIKDFTTNIDFNSVVKTLNNCKKFISPVMSSNGKEVDDKDRSPLFMKGDSYNTTLVKNQFDGYVKMLSDKWTNPISRVVEKDKVKTEKTYSYKDLITSDADLVEHFMQYVQTGQMPDGYADKTIYENMKDLGKVPETQPQGNKTPDQTPVASKENAVTAPIKLEAPAGEKPREKAANDFAASVKGKAFPSKLWTDTYAVEYTLNGKKAVKMFKSSTAQKISK